MLQDLSYAARTFVRKPGFTLLAVLSLASGIGVTTAMFTVLNAVALRPLPYANAEKLVWMTQILRANSTDEVTITPDFLDWRRENRSFTDLAAYNYATRNLTGLDQAIEVRTARVSAALLPLLGVQPAMGRNFLKSEDYRGHDQVAILGNEIWQQRFAGDGAICGKAITLDGRPLNVVGVLPPEFVFPGPDPVQLITPLGKDEAAELQRKDSVSIVFNVIGRLKPGITRDQAHAELTVIQSRLPALPFHPDITIRMLPLRDHLFGNTRTAGLILLAAAGFLLLIACANVSNLLLARLIGRDRELAVRAALGGSRARLISQLFTESALLGALACVLGTVLAWWIRVPLFAWSPYRLAALERLPFDGRVLGFAIAASMLTTMLFGLMPAFCATGDRLEEALKAGAGAVIGGRGSLRVLSLIAAGEIATVFILSTGAALMLESFWKMRYRNLGFQPGHLLTATLTRQAPRPEFIEELHDRVRALPEVQSVAVTNAGELPPGDWHATNLFDIERRPLAPQGSRPLARYPVVSEGYFAMMRIPLVQGRLFQDSDRENTTPVAVVNRALVRRYFPDENPLGKRVRTGAKQPWHTIVGVVGDVKMSGLAAAPEPAIYFHYRQRPPIADIGLIVNSSIDIAGDIRKTVAELDRNQPVARIQAMSDRLSDSVSKPRFTAALLFGFACLAAVLGLVGVYGVMGCRVRWQLRELALRQALGAQQRDVIRHVLRQGLRIIVPGLCLGLLGSVTMSRLLSTVLYEVAPNDPRTFAAVTAGLIATALLACWIPARRAASIDPLAALRHE